MTQKRDKNGRFYTENNERLTRVLSVRLTETDYQAIRNAKSKGLCPREIIVRAIKEVEHEKI